MMIGFRVPVCTARLSGRDFSVYNLFRLKDREPLYIMDCRTSGFESPTLVDLVTYPWDNYNRATGLLSRSRERVHQMKVVEAQVRKEPPGYWCDYTLWLKTANQDLPGQTYRPASTVGLIFSKMKIEHGHTLYFAENAGDVHFFAHSPLNERGYCGAVYKLPTIQDDYSVKIEEIKGPWSSSSCAMARRGFVQAVYVTFHGSLAGNISLAFAKKILKDFNLPYHYVPHTQMGCTPDPFTFVLKPNE